MGINHFFFFQLQLLNDFDVCYLVPTTSLVKSKTSNRSKIELAPELIEWVAERPAFLYPELLPTSALKPSSKSGKDDKPYFAKAEDNLIALGKFFEIHVQSNIPYSNHLARKKFEATIPITFRLAIITKPIATAKHRK